MKFCEGGFALFIFLLAIVSCDCAKTKPLQNSDKEISLGAGKNAFALVFTTSMRGYVAPCGCTSQPLGGLPRIASVMQKVRDNFSLGSLLLDGGDLLFDSVSPTNAADICQETARIDLLLSSLHELSLEGTFVGEFDDAMGKEFRTDRLAAHQITDLTSKAREGYLAASKQFKIGILLLDEKSQGLSEKAKVLKSRGADAVVAFSKLTRKETRALAQAMSPVDVIILAAVSEETPAIPDAVGRNGPFIVSAARQGQYLGVVEFHKNAKPDRKWVLDDREQKRESRAGILGQRQKMLQKQLEQTTDKERLEFLQSRLDDVKSELNGLKVETQKPIEEGFIDVKTIALSRAILEEPAFASRLQAYEKSIPSLVAKCEANVECPKAQPDQASFVGAETCKSCHAAAYDVWKRAVHEVDASDPHGKTIRAMAGHSKAWATLQGVSKTEDRSCVGCHSTGFMQVGGYCKVKEVEFRANVQCEACHGAGSLHAAAGDKRKIRREVPESVCRQCHHVPHIPTTESFVYDDKVQKILGEGHGALLLSKLRHQGASVGKE